jgi:hypothetical protein
VSYQLWSGLAQWAGVAGVSLIMAAALKAGFVAPRYRRSHRLNRPYPWLLARELVLRLVTGRRLAPGQLTLAAMRRRYDAGRVTVLERQCGIPPEIFTGAGISSRPAPDPEAIPPRRTARRREFPAAAPGTIAEARAALEAGRARAARRKARALRAQIIAYQGVPPPQLAPAPQEPGTDCLVRYAGESCENAQWVEQSSVGKGMIVMKTRQRR